MKALHIDAEHLTIGVVEYHGLADLQRLVGGFIEVAYLWPNGDVLYVDEEGLLKLPQRGFRITVRPDQPLAGNGVLVGREIEGTAGTEPPTMTVPELWSTVQFVAFV